MSFLTEAPTYVVSLYFRKIVVPVDGSETSLKALLVAADLALHYGSKVTVINARPRGLKEGEDPLVKAKDKLKNLPITVAYKSVEYDPFNESPQAVLIREIVNEGYDLIVVGARGRTWLSELSLGGVALSLGVNTLVSLLIVR
ncbi:MAG: universal stress protein [Desulfurococcaceae archaeon]